MKKLDTLVISAKCKAMKFVEEYLKKKEAGDENLIVKIMLIIAAVFLVLVFRDQIKDVIVNLITEANTKIKEIYQ